MPRHSYVSGSESIWFGDSHVTNLWYGGAYCMTFGQLIGLLDFCLHALDYGAEFSFDSQVFFSDLDDPEKTVYEYLPPLDF